MTAFPIISVPSWIRDSMASPGNGHPGRLKESCRMHGFEDAEPKFLRALCPVSQDCLSHHSSSQKRFSCGIPLKQLEQRDGKLLFNVCLKKVSKNEARSSYIS